MLTFLKFKLFESEISDMIKFKILVSLKTKGHVFFSNVTDKSKMTFWNDASKGLLLDIFVVSHSSLNGIPEEINSKFVLAISSSPPSRLNFSKGLAVNSKPLKFSNTSEKFPLNFSSSPSK